MTSKKLLAAAVAAITMLVGGLGMALWPSSAGATGAIRKFSGPLFLGGDSQLTVKVHNPHPSYTYKPSVVVRNENGDVTFNHELPVGPNKVVTAFPSCIGACTVEVNMPNALLQPSILYYSSFAQRLEYVHAGDFSR